VAGREREQRSATMPFPSILFVVRYGRPRFASVLSLKFSE